MSRAFLDTSYLSALEFARDQNHASAEQHWQKIIQSSPTLVTTSYIFNEIVTYLNSRGHHTKAIQVGNSLPTSLSVELIHVDQALFYEGWQYFQQHLDKDYSLTDCISFVVMKRLDADITFTFDQHFIQAGFNCEP
jgi:predicted nucleic acid-binding protein